MNKIYVVATPSELKLLENYAIDNSDRIIVTGIGATNVIEALSDIDRKVPIVNIGYCGSNILPVGTKCHVVKSSLYHPTFQYVEKIFSMSAVQGGLVAFDNVESVQCYTSSDFVTSCEYEFPCVFDMELAFICALGFYDVRSDKYVSDNLSVEQFEKNSK